MTRIAYIAMHISIMLGIIMAPNLDELVKVILIAFTVIAVLVTNLVLSIAAIRTWIFRFLFADFLMSLQKETTKILEDMKVSLRIEMKSYAEELKSSLATEMKSYSEELKSNLVKELKAEIVSTATSAKSEIVLFIESIRKQLSKKHSGKKSHK